MEIHKWNNHNESLVINTNNQPENGICLEFQTEIEEAIKILMFDCVKETDELSLLSDLNSNYLHNFTMLFYQYGSIVGATETSFSNIIPELGRRNNEQDDPKQCNVEPGSLGTFMTNQKRWDMIIAKY